MGWSSGGDVFTGVWQAVRAHIPEDKRVEVCEQIIKTLDDHDWDTHSEVLQDKWPEVGEALGYERCPCCNMDKQPEEIIDGHCWNCEDTSQ